jgi:hypothetical protein
MMRVVTVSIVMVAGPAPEPWQKRPTAAAVPGRYTRVLMCRDPKSARIKLEHLNKT